MAKNTVTVLNRLIGNKDDSHITISDLAKRLGDEGFGLIILIFCLPNALPIPLPPGVSTIFALPVLFIAAQKLIGLHSLWMPDFIGKRKIPYKTFSNILKKAVAVIQKRGKGIKPRYEFLTGIIAEKVLIVIIMMLALLISLPIPFGNLVPAVSISIIAIGLVEKDGLMVMLGSFLSLCALLLISGIVMGASQAIVSAIN